MTQRLIECYGKLPKLVSHLHCRASGSDRVLSAMKRGHIRARIQVDRQKVERTAPDLVLSSDFIVGFPETEADFEAR